MVTTFMYPESFLISLLLVREPALHTAPSQMWAHDPGLANPRAPCLATVFGLRIGHVAQAKANRVLSRDCSMDGERKIIFYWMTNLGLSVTLFFA